MEHDPRRARAPHRVVRAGLRRLGAILAVAALGAAPAGAQDRLKVIATIPDLGSLAQTIGGDRVEVDAEPALAPEHEGYAPEVPLEAMTREASDEPEVAETEIELIEVEENLEIELAEAVQDVVGNHPGVEFQPRPTDDPTVRRPDTTRAEEILGWKAQISLRQGLERTLPWFKEVLGH